MLITSFDCKRNRPPGLLIHQQNSQAARSKRRSRRCEAQRREPVNKFKKLLYIYLYEKSAILVYKCLVTLKRTQTINRCLQFLSICEILTDKTNYHCLAEMYMSVLHLLFCTVILFLLVFRVSNNFSDLF
jgi:hypothetical protein